MVGEGRQPPTRRGPIDGGLNAHFKGKEGTDGRSRCRTKGRLLCLQAARARRDADVSLPFPGYKPQHMTEKTAKSQGKTNKKPKSTASSPPLQAARPSPALEALQQAPFAGCAMGLPAGENREGIAGSDALPPLFVVLFHLI